MTVSAIDIRIARHALLKLGASPVSSAEDGTLEAQLFSETYERIRDGLLALNAWQFATAVIEPGRLSGAPDADYGYAFQIPADLVRIISVGTPTTGFSSGVPYRRSGYQIWTDEKDILLRYVFRPTPDTWPPYFETALIDALAAEWCLPLTESTTRAKALAELAEMSFNRSRRADQLQSTAEGIRHFSLLEGR